MPEPPKAPEVAEAQAKQESRFGSAVRRVAWNAAGVLFLGVGLAGVALPGIPTTGPMIAALACFTRGSPRLKKWLLDHPRFGPALRDWQENRTMPKKAKTIALATMSASAAYLGLLAPFPLWAKAAALAFIAVGAVVVGRIPTSEEKSHRV